jgi:hypothetical protein
MRPWLAAVALVAAGPAVAEPQALFQAGRFADAAAAGASASSPAALIAAGRAAATQAGWLARDRREAERLLEDARRLFDRALALEPNNAEALLQRAVATGYLAKLRTSRTLAREARQGFEAAIARAPSDPVAEAALGGWHGESVATLGPLAARVGLGATRAGFERHFGRAAAMNPRGPVVPTFRAFTTLALGGNAADARTFLEAADRESAADGFERLVQREGRAVLGHLRSGDTEAARREAALRSPLGRLGS